MRLPFALAVLMLFSWHGVAHAAQIDWRVSDKAVVGASAPTRRQVEEYLRHEWGLEKGELHVCSFVFVDLAKDGYYRLVMLVDSSGRNSCNEVIVSVKPEINFRIEYFGTQGLAHISDALVDLNHDGTPELLLPEPLKAETCDATWTHIYQWKNGHFADAAAAFPDFYKERLETFKAEASIDSKTSLCAKKEIEKISSILK